MVDITTRLGKGSPLTFNEVDDNFTNLKAAVETGGTDTSALTARVNNLEAADIVIDGRLDGHDSDITALQIVDGAQNGRLDDLEAADVVIDGRLDAIEALDVVQNGRLDDVEGSAVYYASTKSTADTLAASLPDGATVIVDEDEAATPAGVQTRRSVVSGALSAIASFLKTSMIAWKHGGTGAVWRTLYARLMDLPVSVKDFGAVGDGVTDDTAAFNAALAYLASNRINARGLGRIRIPRGRYLCNGTISEASPLTLIFEGDGPEASEIICTNDAGNLFSFGTYIYLEFRDLGVSHVTASDRATWTKRCFSVSGTGGGREFCLRRVQTNKFDRVISFTATVNEDTNNFEGCTFSNFKTFLYSRNSQAVVNKAVQCTWSGYVDRVFDISGFGYTHIDTANVVQSGTFLYLANGSSGDASQYLINNTKLEFWNGPNNNNTSGTTKIVEMQNSASNNAHIKFVKSGISGGTADGSIFQWDMQGGAYTLEVNGGQWGNTLVRTSGRSFSSASNSSWIQFIGCTTSPSTTITRINGAAGQSHVPVVFESCVGIPNILLRGAGGGVGNLKIAGIAKDRNQNSRNNAGYLVIGNTTTTHTFLSFGQLTLVDRVRVAVSGKGGWTGAEIKAFTDSGLLNQIGSTLTPAGGTGTTPEVHEITVPAGTFTSDGVYVTVRCTNASGGAEGLVYVDTLSV